MTTTPLNRVIQHLRRMAPSLDANGLSDGDLLESFIARQDGTAFATLVHRHGPMVMGVCRRVIGKTHDAEDAFQATFLVLVRKAHSVAPREAVGNWLYGVAYRTALEARGKVLRRCAKEKQVTVMPHPEVAPEAVSQDLQAVLDQELSRLQDKYRVPLVLCELEGRTRKEVARQLRLPEGTLSSRLATARRLLAKRLVSRGLAISTGALAAALSANAASACVPAPLAASTILAATLLAAGETAAGVLSTQVAALTEGVLKAMLISKLKVTAAFLVMISLAVLGVGILAHQELTAADRPAAVQNSRAPAAAAQRPPRKQEPTVAGTLQSVDAAASSLTLGIFSRKDGKTEKTFEVSKTAKIVRDGKEAKLVDLTKGSKATLTLSADEKTVVGITAGTPPLSAPLKSVDAAKNTVTVTVGGGRTAKQDKTYELTKDAKIIIDGKEGKLADLKAGTAVTLAVTDGSTVTEVRVALRRDRKQDK